MNSRIMSQELPQALAIVQEAYRQKHGKEPPVLSQENLVSATLIPEAEQISPQRRSLAIIRNLVSLYEDRAGTPYKPAPDTSTPTGATALADLDSVGQPENVKLPSITEAQIQMPETKPTGVPFAKKQFCQTGAIPEAGLRCELPLGMVRVSGLYLPSGGLEATRWPCMLVKLEAPDQSEQRYALLERETEVGGLYRFDTEVVVGPVSNGDKTCKIWLVDCTGNEVRFGIEASVGPRVQLVESQPQRRLHSLTFQSGYKLDRNVNVDSLKVLDDKGEIIGAVVKAAPASVQGSFKDAPDDYEGEYSYLVEVTSSGSSPVSVCVSSLTPTVCVN